MMNVKFWDEWRDFDENLNRLEILVSGTVTAQRVTVKAFAVKYPTAPMFEDQAVFGCGADISLISETALRFLDELYAIGPMEIMVKHYLNGVLNFVGYLDTEQYNDPFSERVNYEVNVTANNGMAVLKRIAMLDNSSQKLSNVYATFDILKLCLSKLSIPYNYIYLGITTTVPNLTLGTGETVLHKLKVKGENYYDEKGRPMSCREVINAIALSYSARVWLYNNSVYILDINTLYNDNLSVKKYNFSNLAYVATESVANHTEIVEAMRSYDVLMKPGVSKVVVKFNKYVYSNPTPIKIEESTLSGYNQTRQRIVDGELKYEEAVYTSAAGYEKQSNPSLVEFIHRKEVKNPRNDEFFVRLNKPATGAYMLRIKSGMFFTSARQFIKLTGQLMVEDTTRYDKEYKHSAGFTFPFYVRVQLSLDGTIITNWYANADGVNPLLQGNVQTWFSSVKTNPVMMSVSDPSVFTINRWHDLNGSFQAVPFTYGLGGNIWGGGSLPGILIPLNNNFYGGTESIKGGHLTIDVFIQNSFPWNMGTGILLKNMGISVVERDEYGNFLEVSNTDVEYVGSIDDNYTKELEVPTIHGTDLRGNSRGLYLMQETGLYTDSDTATNDRLVNAEEFTRQGQTATSEELLLSDYLSNLQLSRYMPQFTLSGYHKPFGTFTTEWFKRGGSKVRFIPVEMELDYINSETRLRLLEFVNNQLTINNP